MARFGIDAAADVGERTREIASDARYHGVRVAEHDHAGSEMVAILIDESLTVAREKSLALEPLVEIGGIGCVSLLQPGIDDLDAAAELVAEIARRFVHPFLANDEQRASQSLLDDAHR